MVFMPQVFMIFSHLCSTGFGLPYSIVTLNEYQFQIYSMVGCPTLCLVWGQACWRVLLCFCSSFSSQHSLHASATERKGLCPRACSSLLSKPLCVLLGARLVIGGAVVVLSLLVLQSQAAPIQGAPGSWSQSFSMSPLLPPWLPTSALNLGGLGGMLSAAHVHQQIPGLYQFRILHPESFLHLSPLSRPYLQ